MFIRYFADTSDSPLGLAALEYMRSFMRVYPVRLVTLTGDLWGRWAGYGQLLATPMLGDFVNCVCSDPSRWVWQQRVGMPTQQVDLADAKPFGEITIPAAPEKATGRVELYTEGKRNILFAVVPPREPYELASAKRYQEVVVPNSLVCSWWEERGRDVVVIEPDRVLPGVMRSIVAPPSRPKVVIP